MIMNIEQFSNQFDVLLSSYSLTPQTGTVGPLEFNEYEKSIFLTEAQNILVKDIYSGRNSMGISYESSEEARRYLSILVNKFYVDVDPPQEDVEIPLPREVWFITYEDCKIEDKSCLDDKIVSVVPTRLDDLYKIKSNPFRGPSSNRILRLDINDKIRLISKYKIKQYNCYYLHVPTPIILTNLGDLNISGYSKPMTCDLNDNLHDTILQMAVKLAITSRNGLITNRDNK